MSQQICIIYVVVVLLAVSGCSSLRPRHASEARLQLGLHSLMARDYAAAERHLQRARQNAPEDYRPVLGLARLYQTRGHDDMARVCYTQAEKMAPENGYVLNNYGAFLCALRQYDKARTRFTRAMRATETGSRTQALLSSGFCLLDAGKTAPAAERLITAIRADSTAAAKILTEARQRLEQLKYADTRFLADIYHQQRSASAESLWLEILYAARQKATGDVKRFGDQLARNYPLSIQYQRYLANEY
ncbi:tetratricopeptide repeat protein [Tatumella citrea]|uniref:Uncharacterized protein n=1 Tax=Tatumella citrea TaxID=53336 RepID=A0A1Y0LA41_TATCI|nr:tetratricopeptide repeat protein [Tatumella citrea]ARU94914.1 hypothetical protein A7K98_14830 [Tatumella citrea]ARU98952.1 hypothetical protein A7K99_14815 [Tatumella citrea]